MTRRHIHRRLACVASTIRNRPIPTDEITAAFETFRTTGVLPTDQRVAQCVAHRVQHAIDSGVEPTPEIYKQIVRQAMNGTAPRPDRYRDTLIREAIWGRDEVRGVARAILRYLASNGVDLTQPVFADRTVPEFGTVGMELLGMPQRLVAQPYEEQAATLLHRLDELRHRIPNNRNWVARLRVAIDRFWDEDELPDDDLMLECAIVVGELGALQHHLAGQDVAVLMREFHMTTGKPHAELRDLAAALPRLAREVA